MIEIASSNLTARITFLVEKHILIAQAHDTLAKIYTSVEDFDTAARHTLMSLSILEEKYKPLDAELGHEYLKAAQVVNQIFVFCE